MLRHTGKHQLSRLALNRFESLTDIQVRHGKIPTSVLQGPFLASVAKFICLGCRNAIATDFRCNLKHKTLRLNNASGAFFAGPVCCVLACMLSAAYTSARKSGPTKEGEYFHPHTVPQKIRSFGFTISDVLSNLIYTRSNERFYDHFCFRFLQCGVALASHSSLA